MNSFNLLKSIAEARPRLRKSEQKVADYVLANPNDVIHMRIVDLASEAQVSEPTVVRFCRALDYDGFQDFKLTLAQGLASNASFEQFSLDSKDTVLEFKQKIFDSMIGNLINIRDQLPPTTLEEAIDALAKAKRVEFYGFGASAPVCADAQHKFYRCLFRPAHADDFSTDAGRRRCRGGDLADRPHQGSAAHSQTGARQGSHRHYIMSGQYPSCRPRYHTDSCGC